jgi:ankyrin repeat protein
MEDTDMTSLYIAISCGLLTITEKLVCKSANPRLRTRDGKTVHDLADKRKKQHGYQDGRNCSAMKDVLLRSHGYVDIRLPESACFWEADGIFLIGVDLGAPE